MMLQTLNAKHIAVFAYKHQQQNAPVLDKLFQCLKEQGAEITFHADFGNYAAQERILNFQPDKISEALPAETDVIISIGGDGTFLRAAKWASDSECPVMGINTGHLGYLTNYTLDDIPAICDALFKNKAIIESRKMLKLEGNCIPDDCWPYALNEITLHKEDTSSMLTVDAELEGETLAEYRADGLIVSTPTGSTAYNLAAGGPIVQPTFNCILLTPIAPHTLTLRPVVISAESRIELTTFSRSQKCRISLDNRSFLIPVGEQITISVAPFSCNIVRCPAQTFAKTLKSKLHWSER